MADFINSTTKQIVLSSGALEHYSNPTWVKIPRELANSLNSIQKKWIVFDNGLPREMTTQEKADYEASLPPPVIRFKSKNQIMTELWLNIVPLSGDSQSLIDEKNLRKERFAAATMTPYWQFLSLHLDNNDYKEARDRALEILAAGVILSGDYAILDSILPLTQ